MTRDDGENRVAARIVSGWSLPNRDKRVPLFGIISWRIAEGWGREFNQSVINRARRIVGFQWRDRIFIGVMIGDGDKPEDPT